MNIKKAILIFLIIGIGLILLEGQSVFSQSSQQEDEEINRILAKVRTYKLNNDKADELYLEGKKLFKAKRYDSALKIFETVLNLDPEHKGALVYKKRILRILATKGDVRQVEEEIVIETQRPVETKVVRARSRKEIRREKEEIQMIRDEMKDVYIKSEAQRRLREGMVYYGAGEIERALEEWQAVLLVDPDNWAAKIYVQEAHRRLEKEAELIFLKEKEIIQKGANEVFEDRMLDVEESYIRDGSEDYCRVIVRPLDEKEGGIEARKEIDKKLDMPVSVDLENARLTDVIDYITDSTGINILVDWNALNKTGAEAKITDLRIRAKDLPVKELLNYVMLITGLKYRVEEHAVLISTQEDIEKESLVTRTYRLKYGLSRLRDVELETFDTQNLVEEEEIY